MISMKSHQQKAKCGEKIYITMRKSRLFKLKSKYFEFSIDKSGQKRYDVLEFGEKRLNFNRVETDA